MKSNRANRTAERLAGGCLLRFKRDLPPCDRGDGLIVKNRRS